MGRFSQGMHVQSWIDPSSAATIASWMMSERVDVTSISALIARAMDTLAEVIVTNGHRAVVAQDEIEEMMLRITRGKRATSSEKLVLGLSRSRDEDTAGDLVSAQAREIYRKDMARRERTTQQLLQRTGKMPRLVVTGDEIEVLPSEADEGEFDVGAMREENE